MIDGTNEKTEGHMRISILSNNPEFTNQHGGVIERYAVDSDIFVSIKLKYIEPLLGLPIKRHDIHFRSDSKNFVFGLDDYRHLLEKVCSNTNFYLINDSDRLDHDTANDTKGIQFQHFDKGPIERHLGSFREGPVFEGISRYAQSEGQLDMRRISTGFMVILHYSLQYPEAKLHLLGFFESGNRKVLKEGKIIRETHFHDFEEERKLLGSLVGNAQMIH
jgi:hypothetical protein